MKASASSLLFLLCTGTTAVYAQDANATLNEKEQLGRQLMAQSCGICHLSPSMGTGFSKNRLNKKNSVPLMHIRN